MGEGVIFNSRIIKICFPSLFATHPICVLSVSQKVKKKHKFENLYQMVLMNIIYGFNEQILIIAIWLCQYNTFRLLIIKLFQTINL